MLTSSTKPNPTLLTSQLWLVSDCSFTCGASKRRSLTDELVAAGLPIDRIGRCFNNANEFPHTVDLSQSERLHSYKFYVAFENSHNCRDYITEKLWRNALLAGVVPIVWGPRRADVAAVAPPGSFVHADDFGGDMAALAGHVAALDADDGRYRELLRWREDANATEASWRRQLELEQPEVQQQPDDGPGLCAALHERRKKPKKVIASLYDEFVGGEPPECTQVHTKQEIVNWFVRVYGWCVGWLL